MTATWVGRGFEDVPGKPFGWAWHMEREEIRKHILSKMKHVNDIKGARRQWATHRGLGIEWYITKVQDRIHRGRPNLRQRQLAMGNKQPRVTPRFTHEELEMIAEKFEGANHPVGLSIWVKASSYEP